MFRKPFRIKSNNQAKGSERKNIKDQLLKSFPNLTEADLESLLPKKEVLNVIKLVTSSEETVVVYTIQKRPMVFEVQGKLYPTVYLLWKFCDLIPSFITHPQVANFLNSGADLMLPGVITPPQNHGNKYGNMAVNSVAYVGLAVNKAAIGVGATAQSSNDMNMTGKGKCLIVYHSYGDKLCSLEGLAPQPMPQLGPPDWLIMGTYDDDFPELGATRPTPIRQEEPTAPEMSSEPIIPFEAAIDDSAPGQEDAAGEEMDNLVNYCFFVAIKYSKTLTLPILTSNFYKLQMIPQCPEGKSLDLKKTTYKKLKPFLDNMGKLGIITVKEMKKGVESIIAINRDHPKYTEFYVEPQNRPKKETDIANTTQVTSVTESYAITQNVLPIFADAGLNKGDTIQTSQIRKYVTEYVKKHNCQDENNKRLINPKEILTKICKTENAITWEELMEKVCESMKSCYKVSSGYEEVFNKGKVSSIILTVSTRSGNKKVTLIDNLELFGIRIAEFAKECQHGVAASTSISNPPGKKCSQLLVQGNQVLFINNLLTEKYKIPQKYIKGLEYAPKKRK